MSALSLLLVILFTTPVICEEEVFSVVLYKSLPCQKESLHDTYCLHFVKDSNSSYCFPANDLVEKATVENSFLIVTKKYVEDYDAYRFVFSVYIDSACSVPSNESFSAIETSCFESNEVFGPDLPGLRLYRFCYDWKITTDSLLVILFFHPQGYFLSFFFSITTIAFVLICLVHLIMVQIYTYTHPDSLLIFNHGVYEMTKSKRRIKDEEQNIITNYDNMKEHFSSTIGESSEANPSTVHEESGKIVDGSINNENEDENDWNEELIHQQSNSKELVVDQEESTFSTTSVDEASCEDQEANEGGTELINIVLKEDEEEIVGETAKEPLTATLRGEVDEEDENYRKHRSDFGALSLFFYSCVFPLTTFCSIFSLTILTPLSDLELMCCFPERKSFLESQDMILLKKFLFSQDIFFYLRKIWNTIKSLILILTWVIINSLGLILAVLAISSYQDDVNDPLNLKRQNWNSSMRAVMQSFVLWDMIVLILLLLINVTFRLTSTFQTAVFVSAWQTNFHYRLFQCYVNSMGILFALHIGFDKGALIFDPEKSFVENLLRDIAVIFPISLMTVKIVRVMISRGVGASSLMIIYKRIPFTASLLMPDPGVRFFWKVVGNPRKIVLGTTQALSILTDEKMRLHEGCGDYHLLAKHLSRNQKYKYIQWNLINSLDHDGIYLLKHLLTENSEIDIYPFLFTYLEGKKASHSKNFSKKEKKLQKKEPTILTDPDKWMKKDCQNLMFELPRYWIPAKFFYNHPFSVEYAKSFFCFMCSTGKKYRVRVKETEEDNYVSLWNYNSLAFLPRRYLTHEHQESNIIIANENAECSRLPN